MAKCESNIADSLLRAEKGDTFDTAEFITNIDGLAFPQFETVGGLYKYWIVGVDSAGNRGEPQFTHANVAQPPDYILKYDHNSEYDGVKTDQIRLTVNFIFRSKTRRGSNTFNLITSRHHNRKSMLDSRFIFNQQQ